MCVTRVMNTRHDREEWHHDRQTIMIPKSENCVPTVATNYRKSGGVIICLFDSSLPPLFPWLSPNCRYTSSDISYTYSKLLLMFLLLMDNTDPRLLRTTLCAVRRVANNHYLRRNEEEVLVLGMRAPFSIGSLLLL